MALKPKDFKVYEDDIPQKVATFAEGTHAPLQVLDNGSTRPLHAADSPRGSSLSAQRPDVVDLRQDSYRDQCVCSVRYEQLHVSRVSSTPPMRSPILFAAWIAPIRWRSTPTAAI